MKYDVIVTDAENILELDDLQDNLLRLDCISEEEVKHIVDIRSGFSRRNSRALSRPWPIFSPL